MFDVERICSKISRKIGQELNYDENRIAVVNYGIFAIMQTAFSVLLVAIFGFIFGVFIEALIVAFSASILRKYSGGVHASTPKKCAIFGAVLSVGMASLIINISVSFRVVVILGIMVFVLSYYLIVKLAPVDSAAKPIRKHDNIDRLKKSSILILTLYLIIIIWHLMSYLVSGEKRNLIYSLCIYAGTLWQVFSLTQYGHKFLHRIDALF